MTTVDVGAVIDPNDAAANALVRWAVFDTSGTKITDRSFANADQTFTADWSNNNGFVFKAGVDINNDGVLATEEMAHTINLAATTIKSATNVTLHVAAGGSRDDISHVVFTDTVFAPQIVVKGITAAGTAPPLGQGDITVAKCVTPGVNRSLADVTVQYTPAAVPAPGTSWVYNVVLRDQNDKNLEISITVTVVP